ncbi:MAG: hypothetical protein RLZZ19_868, partial [Actinomycetota bacterium]
LKHLERLGQPGGRDDEHVAHRVADGHNRHAHLRKRLLIED